MSNYFYYMKDCEYPRDRYYRPDTLYPEYPFKKGGLSEEKNDVYGMIRNLFWNIGFDKENFGTEQWNALGQYIKEGQTVLIKPNLVLDRNSAEKDLKKGMECLVTHPSVVRCIMDYVLIALRGTGEVIIADAPIQDCNFHKLKRTGGYQGLEEFYKKYGIGDFKVQDLRKVILKDVDGRLVQSENTSMEFKTQIINLSSKSYFYKKNYNGKLRITNYDAKDVNNHHNGKIQEYCLNSICLEADVIISIPKPKTHRLAGYTGALKNFIGVNARKEYLPHHRKGGVVKSGDEYPVNDKVKQISSFIDDLKNMAYKKKRILMSDTLRKFNCFIMKNHKDKIRYGMWYGNDTIWRTILDLNRIIHYSDKDGNIRGTVQRRIIHIGDMLVCGEKEGPLTPSYKKVGGILFADNAVEFDLFLTKLMGFDYLKFPTLKYAMNDRMLFDKSKDIYFDSNAQQYSGRLAEKIDNFAFLPTSGWKGYI